MNPLHLKMLCAKFGRNWPNGSGEENFKISSMYFHYFVIIFPRKRAGLFIWTKLNPLLPKILFANFGRNWLSGSGGGDFFKKFVNVISLYCNYLPLEKGGALHLNNLNPRHLRDTLCQVWLKLAQWSWRRWKFEKFTDRQTDGLTDRRRTTSDQKSSLELKMIEIRKPKYSVKVLHWEDRP